MRILVTFRLAISRAHAGLFKNCVLHMTQSRYDADVENYARVHALHPTKYQVAKVCLMMFIYKDNHDDGSSIQEGTTMAISHPGGRTYSQRWCPIKFGGTYPLPMDYFTIQKPDLELQPRDTNYTRKSYAGVSIVTSSRLRGEHYIQKL